MNCHKIHSGLISGQLSEEMQKHLEECASCRSLNEKVHSTMSILEDMQPAPSHLAASIMARKGDLVIPKRRKLSIQNYFQVAAAILFGVFIGYQFGKIANLQVHDLPADPMHMYFKAHHLNVDRSASETPFLFIDKQP